MIDLHWVDTSIICMCTSYVMIKNNSLKNIFSVKVKYYNACYKFNYKCS